MRNWYVILDKSEEYNEHNFIFFVVFIFFFLTESGIQPRSKRPTSDQEMLERKGFYNRNLWNLLKFFVFLERQLGQITPRFLKWVYEIIKSTYIPWIGRILKELSLGRKNYQSNLSITKNWDLMSLFEQTGPPFGEGDLPAYFIFDPLQLNPTSPHFLLLDYNKIYTPAERVCIYISKNSENPKFFTDLCFTHHTWKHKVGGGLCCDELLSR